MKSLSSMFNIVREKASNQMAMMVKDMTSHRLMWNYIYMALYVFIAMWLTLFNAEHCGNAVIITTGGVVSAIFTNVVWSKTLEKKNKETKNAVPEIDPNEDGAGD
jgi:hypothetical protein